MREGSKSIVYNSACARICALQQLKLLEQPRENVIDSCVTSSAY